MADEIDQAVETIETAEQEAQNRAGEIVDSAFDTGDDIVDAASDQADALINDAKHEALKAELHGRMDGLENRVKSLEESGAQAAAVIVPPAPDPLPNELPVSDEPEIPELPPEETPPVVDAGGEPPIDDIKPNQRNRHWWYAH